MASSHIDQALAGIEHKAAEERDIVQTIDDIDFSPQLIPLSQTREFRAIGSSHLDRLLPSWVNLFILDYSGDPAFISKDGKVRNPTRTLKGIKAKFTLDYCVSKGYDVLLFGNFGKEGSTISEGSAMDAFELVSYYYPKTQVIGFVPLKEHETKPYISIDPINPQEKNGRQKIRIHINTKKYLAPQDLERIFEGCIEGRPQKADDPLSYLYQSEAAQNLREYLKRQGIEGKKSIAVTNISEFAPNDNTAYFYEGELQKLMSKMHLIIGTAGTAERFRGQILSVPPTYANGDHIQTGPAHIIVTTSGNPLAKSLSWHRNSIENRLDTPFPNSYHDLIIGHALDPRYGIRLCVVPDEDKEIGAGIVQAIGSNILGNIPGGITGSMAFAVLSKDYCVLPSEVEKNRKDTLDPSEVAILTKGNMLMRNLYSYARSTEIGVYKNPLQLSPLDGGYNVCVVYTGKSDDRFLKQQIASTEGLKREMSILRAQLKR